MNILTNEQMKWMDQETISAYGIPGLLLMERASLGVFHKGMELVRDHDLEQVVIFCGPGNNGGDGLAAARHFDAEGVATSLVILSDPAAFQGDALANFRMLANRDITIHQDMEALQRKKRKSWKKTLFIDAIFGTGLTREVEGDFLQAIRWINDHASLVLSVDIPSGIHGNSGKVLGQAVRATETVTFHLPKVGNCVYPGAAWNGNLTVVPIGIPLEVAPTGGIVTRLHEGEDIAYILPKRPADAHKGTFGTLTVVGGIPGYTGAGILAAKGAQASGVGLVKVAAPERSHPYFESALFEAVTMALEEDASGFTPKGHHQLATACESAGAVVAGPGWGREVLWLPVLEQILKPLAAPLVLDADGLNLIAGNTEWLKERKGITVITPHPGEMARLTGHSIEHINENRLETALEAAQQWQVVVVLKGAGTIIASPEGYTAVNPTGNPGMAKAGSGDVLAGIIGSILAQGVEPYHAAVAGCWIHGRAGDLGAQSVGRVSLTAGHLIEQLPAVFGELKKNQR